MEMQIGWFIQKLEFKVRLAQNRQDSIVAFGEVWAFLGSSLTPIFKVKGFTIKLKKFQPNGRETMVVDFPAFGSAKSVKGYQTAFILEDKELFGDFCNKFIEAYYEISGGVLPSEIKQLNEDIRPEEVPL